MIKQFFDGKQIRFIEKDNEYWAIAGDVAKALGYSHTPHLLRMVDKEDVTTHIVDITSNKKKARKTQKVNIMSEAGIYEAIWNSRRDEAKEFKKWVKQVIRELRQTIGLKQHEVFHLMDKQHQRKAMDVLQKGLSNPNKISYIKCQTVVNKCVSTLFGYDKALKKEQMSEDMLIIRQQILDDTVDLMTSINKFGLDISVSKTIYNKYLNTQATA
ncbi:MULTISPECIES: BRO-N domain-containing protein [Staphylococcus]|uniref:BRO-N domain-containing protein n=1 Tax=Staphylococcus saprophyticus TaxID=29385 RepID=UPI0008533713|nr:Bro-N domain-containing protein [Staphylococcus saprophyticus]MDW3859767.1 Bro-N domain-containing protein [Staphylococcus saprophyticus]MDW3899611.1 Bro-N domain-containing protein [Staphylococcus saprophyticus]MDW3923816.1 Bro-N domain-containing protein [Staphylococcus saprophyticus]MDW3960266.1 Bro-N domain-containing protein [Staphylococcus saprophyticus]MDW3969893.1 Bro-N domain-containing protein [Staphylococcus saprophyticus]